MVICDAGSGVWTSDLNFVHPPILSLGDLTRPSTDVDLSQVA